MRAALRFRVIQAEGAEVGWRSDDEENAEIERGAWGTVGLLEAGRDGGRMSAEMRPYVVRQGDYLTKLAFVHGFEVEEVWQHPKNDEIRGKRPDHHLLAPGDVVHLPVKAKEGLPITKGTTNRYKARAPKIEVVLAFQNADGTPLAGEPYEVRGLPPTGEALVSSGEGHVILQVPVTAREVTIAFPDRHFAFTARIGDLDPADTRSGAVQRLENLGHVARGTSLHPGEEEPIRAGIAAFQANLGAAPTGDLDDSTRAALVDSHGI